MPSPATVPSPVRRALWWLLAAALGCSSTVQQDCDDGDPCTLDLRSVHGDCTYRIWRGRCDDGDPCTSDETCATTVCIGKPLNCDDAIACTVDHCGKDGCVHLAAESTLCNDGNGCTADACDLAAGCTHTATDQACDDGSVCTSGDICSKGACKAKYVGPQCDDKNPCTADSCEPKSGQCVHLLSDAPCDDGKPCTLGDICTKDGCAGTFDCTCAAASGQTATMGEDCATPFDDNCDGKINDEATCGATTYAFSDKPGCGAACYYDEAHNIAVSGPGEASNTTGVGTFATGQLRDGVRGKDDWGANLGHGVAWEWVAWSVPKPTITFRFAGPRQLTRIRIGINNRADGVAQPEELQLRYSADGKVWTAAKAYRASDNSLPMVAKGKRGDVELEIGQHITTFVEVAFVTPGSWTFVDEFEFE